MKCLILLILICSMIGFPAKAVNPVIPVAVGVSSDEHESLIEGYLKRELRQLDGIKVVPEAEWRDAKWMIHIVAVRLNNGLYAVSQSSVRVRYIEPYLKLTIKKELREWLAFVPEYAGSSITTGRDLKNLCERIIVGVEDDIRRY